MAGRLNTTPASRGRMTPAPGTAASLRPRRSSWTEAILKPAGLVRLRNTQNSLRFTNLFLEKGIMIIWCIICQSASLKTVLSLSSVCVSVLFVTLWEAQRLFWDSAPVVKKQDSRIVTHRLVEWWRNFLLRLASEGWNGPSLPWITTNVLVSLHCCSKIKSQVSFSLRDCFPPPGNCQLQSVDSVTD